MNERTGWQTIWRWLGFPQETAQPLADDRVAREAIRFLREAELDFHRAGQATLSNLYRSRAASLEQRLPTPPN